MTGLGYGVVSKDVQGLRALGFRTFTIAKKDKAGGGLWIGEA